MPKDHPDGISPISVSRADIKAPIDIQKQSVTVKIDIIAQTLATIQINIASSSVTLDINIAAAAAGVTLNVNVKSQTANISVNLAASAITLDINIKSQTANINVNLAASAITLDINIKSQTANINVKIAASDVTVTVSVTGTAQVNLYAQNVGLYLKPEWEAKEGNDKGFQISNVNMVWGNSSYVEYDVPAGKTLYITSMGFGIFSAASDDYDHYLYGECYIYNATSVATIARVGGLGGGSLPFSQPLVIPAGEKFQGSICCYAGVTCRMAASFWGYEI